ncbi:hypothetical protein BDN70DRAFT_898559 [Pholiota conissans]|uniref:Uncharacterized protein n=1 Tax=Pholiota conissans TaxID=109636 RepID=A0A9P5YW24_9AGAR|nr:hypothetical protein BDN70DRAFT_898559 [Pholiota conissans]
MSSQCNTVFKKGDEVCAYIKLSDKNGMKQYATAPAKYLAASVDGTNGHWVHVLAGPYASQTSYKVERVERGSIYRKARYWCTGKNPRRHVYGEAEKNAVVNGRIRRAVNENGESIVVRKESKKVYDWIPSSLIAPTVGRWESVSTTSILGVPATN